MASYFKSLFGGQEAPAEIPVPAPAKSRTNPSPARTPRTKKHLTDETTDRGSSPSVKVIKKDAETAPAEPLEESLPLTGPEKRPKVATKHRVKYVPRERRFSHVRTWEDQRRSRPSPKKGEESKKRKRAKPQTRFREKQAYYNDPVRGGTDGFAVAPRAVRRYVGFTVKKFADAEDGSALAAIAHLNQVTQFRNNFYEVLHAFLDDHASEIIETAAANAKRSRGGKGMSGVTCFAEDIESTIGHIVTCRNR